MRRLWLAIRRRISGRTLAEESEDASARWLAQVDAAADRWAKRVSEVTLADWQKASRHGKRPDGTPGR